MTSRCHATASFSPQVPVWSGPSLQELTLTTVSGAALNAMLATGQCSPNGKLQIKADGRLVCLLR